MSEETDKISTNSAVVVTETEMQLPILHDNRNNQYLSGRILTKIILYDKRYPNKVAHKV